MTDFVDCEFAWDFFESTGNIESYLLYNQFKNLSVGNVSDENNSDNGTGFENL